MNKTITINISGVVFHIEEQAYTKLDNYLIAVKSSINTEGKDEIIEDIESRIAELLSSRKNEVSFVVTESDVNEIITIMGQPEDYHLEDEENKTNDSGYNQDSNSQKTKKLYRDEQNRILGGVLAGLGHYFNIDPVWLRIIAIILVFAFGLSIWIYPILWLIVPKAATTAQILEMKGEPVNINTIQRMVSENISEIGNKIKNYNPSYLKNTASTATTLLRRFFGIALIILGVIGIVVSIVIALVFYGVLENKFTTLQDIEFSYPHWAMSLALFGIFVIPALLVLVLGCRLIYKNIKNLGIVVVLLLSVFITSVVYFGITVVDSKVNINNILDNLYKRKKYATNINVSENILTQNDTLTINFVDDPRFEKSEIGEFLKSDNIEIEIVESKGEGASIDINNHIFQNVSNSISVHNGKTSKRVIKRPTALEYHYSITDNKADLANAIMSKTPIEANEVEILVRIPANKFIKIDGKDREFFTDNESIEQGTHIYQFRNGKLQCVSCGTGTI